ncbi:MAG: polymer-forming cytoskeletal protein [Bdellovibrionales bacterium]
MFGARKSDGEVESQENAGLRNDGMQAGQARVSEAASPSPRMAAPAQVTPPHRVVDIPRAARRAHPMSEDSRTGDARTLRVGKGLSVAGEITSCDVLIVEGKVEAKLNDGKMLEITESGQFRGSVEIENADIAGRYDGQLVVHGRLTVRSTGRISGMVKYGELEVNAGGQIIGEMQVTTAGAAAGSTAGPYKGGAKFSSFEETEEQRGERRSA